MAYPNLHDMVCSSQCRRRECECSCTLDSEFEGFPCGGADFVGCEHKILGSGCGLCEIHDLCFECAERFGCCMWCSMALIPIEDLQAELLTVLAEGPAALLPDLIDLVLKYCVLDTPIEPN